MLDFKLECVSGTVIHCYRIGKNLIIIGALQQQDVKPLAAPVPCLHERLYRQQ